MGLLKMIDQTITNMAYYQGVYATYLKQVERGEDLPAAVKQAEIEMVEEREPIAA